MNDSVTIRANGKQVLSIIHFIPLVYLTKGLEMMYMNHPTKSLAISFSKVKATNGTSQTMVFDTKISGQGTSFVSIYGNPQISLQTMLGQTYP